MPGQPDQFDLAIIGGGINGAGIACDAAGRGLSVLLVEADDLAGATSSASSKLIHGGLRYLEQWEFRLVREALAEREVLLAKAPHIIWPLRFVLPHVASLRPRWMIRAGLFLYDHLSSRNTIPASRSLNLKNDAAGVPLKDGLGQGYSYWDCWVDDARLVVLNARAAANGGADIRTRTRFISAGASDGRWQLRLRDENTGVTCDVNAGAIVNAAGPWVDQVLQSTNGQHPKNTNKKRSRLVKGSHLVLPRIKGADDAYILQLPDKRVVFVLPYEENYSLVGTTDIPFDGDAGSVEIDSDEIDYLLGAVAAFFSIAPKKEDIVWTYSGVRPLFDDDSGASASKVTRDYHLDMVGQPPVLSVFGGKITTYRCLAEEALEKLSAVFPAMGRPWTADQPLPGGDIPDGNFAAFLEDLSRRYSGLDAALVAHIARRHGTLSDEVLGNARRPDDLGAHIGADLYEREVVYMKDNEWAGSAEDILWRRTKAGVGLTPDQLHTAASTIGAIL
jgi:glycerol-3-phosphate dehydrogenase